MNWRPSLLARWSSLSPREQAMLRLAAALVSLALLWSIMLSPALHTLRGAPAQHQSLEVQLRHMQRLQAQAQALQTRPAVRQEEVVRALQASLAPLGAGAQLRVSGEQATLTLQQIPAPALAQWLTQIRSQTQLLPTQAKLTRMPPAATWDGTLLFTLPPR